ncbi:MAG: glycerol-3-phosphate dehydrogenase/oxidase [marine benthic group bacterium]|nr:glycerol-3-phosphate dehydrogenase/oxidase [Gemmatimonadota bacterium]
MNRADFVSAASAQTWDVVVVGGGATGLGVAVEAASRGYSTLLLEQADFAKGTSSRSTKLIHGGVRYLQQGDVSLVLEALHERGLLIQNAPHLVHHLAFVVPVYDWWEGPFYGIGLKLYDALAGKLGLGPSKNLSREETLERIPTVEPDGLRGGVVYYDGQFDDSRLAVTLVRTLADLGGTPLNYMRVIGLLRSTGESGSIEGVRAVDGESGQELEIGAQVVVSATGVFTDEIRRMDDSAAGSMVTASQGVHIVLDRSFLPGDTAIMVPHTSDGRVLFAVPWHGRVVVGTTDTPVPEASLEPRALDDEIEFLLTHAIRYLTRDPLASDVLSVFAGLRPLVGSPDSETKAISRDHTLLVSPSGLVTITGGKWTTYRRMGSDTVTQAALVAGLPERASVTEELRLHGWTDQVDPIEPWSVYGSDWLELEALERARPELAERLHPALPYRASEVVWAARFEMARTVEDVLSRRLRALLLDARASVEMAPRVAQLMAEELGRDEAWAESQVAEYAELAKGYVL